MAKVMVASSMYPPNIIGGGEKSTQSLCYMLANLGHDVISVSFDVNESVERDHKVEVVRLEPSISYPYVASKNQGPLGKVLWRLREEYSSSLAKQIISLAKDKNVDIIITSTIEDVSTHLWRLASDLGIKVVHVLRSYYLMCWSGTMYRRQGNCPAQCVKCRMLNYIKRRNSKYPDAVVGIGKTVLDTHLKAGYFSGVRQYIIPNLCGSKVMDRKGFRNNSGYITIGYLGRLHHTKGVEDIIEAVWLSGKAQYLRILIGGDGDKLYIDELKAMAAKYGVNVSFLGLVDAGEFLQKIDVLTVPSKWREPFGRVVVESFFRGVPVIGASVGGIKDLIDKSSGWLYSSVDALASIYQDLTFDEISGMTFENINRFEEDAIASEWNRLFDDMGVI